VKANTLKVKAETLERHGIGADDGDDESEDDEIRQLQKRNERVYAELEREEAKLTRLEGRKPLRRLVRRRLHKR
jgi:hypothetical protein